MLFRSGQYDYFFSERRKKTSAQWLKSEELPFETVTRESVHSVFSELDRTVLQIRIPGAQDGYMDMLYIYFDPRASYLGMRSAENELTADQKALLGQIIYRLAKSLTLQLDSDKQTFVRYVQNTRSLARKLQAERNRLEHMQKGIGQSLISLTRELLKSLAGNNGVYAKLSETAENMVRNYSGDIETLRKVIINAYQFACSLEEHNRQEITLHDWHLNFETSLPQEIRPSEDHRYQEKKMGKAGYLLDRLEFAAIRVTRNGLAVIGKNLGLHCEKTMSAPAISDALKKYQVNIRDLLEKYPEKWPILRTSFTPVKNLQPDPPEPVVSKRAV